MNDKLVEALKNLESHADALMRVPASEQFIGNIQSIVSVAILETKRAIEALAKEIDK